MLNVNEYFDGAVKSIAFENQDGPVTAGVMEAGDYEFGTSQKEQMKVVSGELIVKLPGSEEFVSYPAGTEFNLDAGVKFQVQVKQTSAYICIYS